MVIAMTGSILLIMSLMPIVSVMTSPSPTRGDHANANRPTRIAIDAKPQTTPNESADATEPPTAA